MALIWSRKEADAVHMFGYGRAQNVAALVAPVEEASRISEVVKEKVHKEIKGGYCFIHVDAYGIP
jgi:divalent metal cation (Fe/Co/Zn/Cd) transporter